MKSKLFSDKDFYKKLWSLAFPIAVQSFMLASVAAADAFMLGGYDQNSMSAVSLATQIQFIQNMIMESSVSGMAILGAQYWGKGDRGTVADILCICLRICGVTSLIFFAGCEFAPGYLMRIFTNEPELIEIGIGYLRIAGWSYLLTGLSQCYLTVMKVSEHAKITATISVTTVLLNILLNAVFIFGLMGAPRLGAQGAAIATLIARIIEFLWAFIISYRPGFIRLEFKRFIRRKKQLAADFWKCILPLIGAWSLWGVGFTSYSAFMGHMGTDAAAANSVAAVIRDLICCLCAGIASGGGILVGNELGAGNTGRGRVYGDRLCILAFLCGIASALIMLAFTPLILSFVKLTDKAQEYLLGMMLVMSFYMIGRAVNTIVINGIFAAGGDTVFDMYSLLVCMWGIAVPLAFLGTFVLNWPVIVVYACTCLDEVGKIPWVMLHFRKHKWVKNLTRDNV